MRIVKHPPTPGRFGITVGPLGIRALTIWWDWQGPVLGIARHKMLPEDLAHYWWVHLGWFHVCLGLAE